MLTPQPTEDVWEVRLLDGKDASHRKFAGLRLIGTVTSCQRVQLVRGSLGTYFPLWAVCYKTNRRYARRKYCRAWLTRVNGRWFTSDLRRPDGKV